MAVEAMTAAALTPSGQAEIDELRRGLLPVLLLVTVALAWTWFGYGLFQEWDLVNVVPTLTLCALIILANRLRARHHNLACELFLLGLILFTSLITFLHPTSRAMALGTLVVLAANALLGTRAAVCVTPALWLAQTLAYRSSTGSDYAGLLDMLLLYSLTLGLAWLVARPLRHSVESANLGWERARQALTEVQQRRGELYRTVRALEEATYRLEHANNALLVAQREAEEAHALKARFVATVSHEIRGPLNLILGFSRMMALFPERYAAPLPADYQEDVATVYRNSQHLMGLVDDVLDLSQIEAQRLPLVKDHISLEEDVVQKTVAVVQSLAERKGLYLRQQLAGNLPWILADAVRLRQALLNLLTNAIRLTEKGGITVSTSRQRDRLRVCVQDSGPGVAPADLPKLFKEFRQVQATETRTGAGSGLGLSICKHLVELHGGEIGVESQLGVGTTFHFTLPLPDSSPLPSVTVRTEERPLPVKRKSCLVVHDDPTVVRVLGRYLEGYHVVGALDSHEWLPLLEELYPQAIITTEELQPVVERQLAQLRYTMPLITCALPRRAVGGPGDGRLTYLAKPVVPEMLAAVMKSMAGEGEATVLLVDDDPDAVRLLQDMLTQRHGAAPPRPYIFLRAYDGQQALEQMRATVPSIVLMDWVMPGLDGEQVLAAMRADARLREVPVVVVSARDWVEEYVPLGRRLGVHWRTPLALADGARCLAALLEVLQ